MTRTPGRSRPYAPALDRCIAADGKDLRQHLDVAVPVLEEAVLERESAGTGNAERNGGEDLRWLDERATGQTGSPRQVEEFETPLCRTSRDAQAALECGPTPIASPCAPRGARCLRFHSSSRQRSDRGC